MRNISFLIYILGAAFIVIIGILSQAKTVPKPTIPPPKISISNSIPPVSSPENLKPEEPSLNIKFSVPILMYHYIRDYHNPDDKIGTNLSVSPKIFADQVRWLKENGYQSVNFSYFSRPDSAVKKPIIFTFDDGYEDAYTDAYPILKKNNFTGVFYIVTGFVGKGNYLNWEQIKTMSENGMIIGSHTLNHIDLEKADSGMAKNEIEASKKILEEKINKKIYDFCYPSGKYNDAVIDSLKKAGYQTATTVKGGIATEKNSYFELPRIRMTEQTNLEKILSL